MKKTIGDYLKGFGVKEEKTFEDEYDYKETTEEGNKVFENEKGEQVIYCD